MSFAGFNEKHPNVVCAVGAIALAIVATAAYDAIWGHGTYLLVSGLKLFGMLLLGIFSILSVVFGWIGSVLGFCFAKVENHASASVHGWFIVLGTSTFYESCKCFRELSLERKKRFIIRIRLLLVSVLVGTIITDGTFFTFLVGCLVILAIKDICIVAIYRKAGIPEPNFDDEIRLFFAFVYALIIAIAAGIHAYHSWTTVNYPDVAETLTKKYGAELAKRHITKLDTITKAQLVANDDSAEVTFTYDGNSSSRTLTHTIRKPDGCTPELEASLKSLESYVGACLVPFEIDDDKIIFLNPEFSTEKGANKSLDLQVQSMTEMYIQELLATYQ